MYNLFYYQKTIRTVFTLGPYNIKILLRNGNTLKYKNEYAQYLNSSERNF